MMKNTPQSKALNLRSLRLLLTTSSLESSFYFLIIALVFVKRHESTFSTLKKQGNQKGERQVKAK